MINWILAFSMATISFLFNSSASACPAWPVDINFDGSPYAGDRGLVYDPASGRLMLRDRDGSKQSVSYVPERKTWCLTKINAPGAIADKKALLPACFNLNEKGESDPFYATDNKTKELYGKGHVSDGELVLTDKDGFNHISISATKDGYKIRYNKKVCDNSKFSGCAQRSEVALHKAIEGTKDLGGAIAPSKPDNGRKITLGGNKPSSFSVVGCEILNNSADDSASPGEAQGLRN
jgi:hypothetical protein